MPPPTPSGDYAFTTSAIELINAALRLCNVIAQEETASGYDLQQGMSALNMMAKAWGVKGLHIWTQDVTTITPVVGQAVYTIGLGSGGVDVVRPLRVSGARRIVTATQAVVPLIPMSRLDLANLSNKTSPTGQPANFFYDPQIPYGKLTIYPAPADTLSTIQLTSQRPIQDFTDLSDAPDFPDEWFQALKFGLAVDLAPEYGVPAEVVAQLVERAKDTYETVKAWDQELQGTTAYPFSQAVFQVIARALRIVKATGPQEIPSLGQVNNAFVSLNGMVQEWQASGIHVWCEQEGIMFPEVNQVLYRVGGNTTDHFALWDTLAQTALGADGTAGASTITVTSDAGIEAGYILGIVMSASTMFWTTVSGTPVGDVVTLATVLPADVAEGAVVFAYPTAMGRPLRVYGGRRYIYLSRIENPMIQMARLDYMDLPNKYNQGTITQFFFDPQLGTNTNNPVAQVNVWPAPSDTSAGMRFTSQRPLQVFEDLTSAQDFPAEWTNALVYNLARELAPEYDLPPEGFSMLQMMAADKLMTAKAWDREPEAILFGYAAQPGYRTM